MKKLPVESLAAVWAVCTVGTFILLLLFRMTLFPYPFHYAFTEAQKADNNARLASGDLVLPQTEDAVVWNDFMVGLGGQRVIDVPNLDLLEIGVIVLLSFALGFMGALVFSPLNKNIRYIVGGVLLLSPFWIRLVVPPLRLGLVIAFVLAITVLIFFRKQLPGMDRTTAAYQAAQRDYDRR